MKDILHRLADMPVLNFRMKKQADPSVRWMGPTAQDFLAAFRLGKDNTHINTGNELGVALAAIKGLYEELQDRDAKIAANHEQIAADHALLAARDARIAALEEGLASQKAAIANTVETVTRLSRAVMRERQAERGQE